MSLHTCLVQQGHRLWRFLGFFQPPTLRVLHLVLLGGILIQLVSGAALSLYAPSRSLQAGLTALHMLTGAATAALGLFFVGLCLCTRGLRHYYSYLFGDVTLLVSDLRATLRLRTVPPRPRGLACTVQGLGLGALALVSLTGLAWFISWYAHCGAAHWLKGAHKAAALLIWLYLAGHGGMALLHFGLWQRRVRNTDPVAQPDGASAPDTAPGN